jgi:hypothetical protein
MPPDTHRLIPASLSKPITFTKDKVPGKPLLVGPAKDGSLAARQTAGIADIQVAANAVIKAAAIGDTTTASDSDAKRDATRETHLNDVATRMHALAPADGLEGMTATLLIAVQDAAVKALTDSTRADTYTARASSASRASRLVEGFVKLADLRARLRGGGTQQRVTVEHVTVAAGGQAVIGAVAGAGGGGSAARSDNAPHAQA